jgi:polar amino acid transport system substrate-binding protein
MADIRDRGVLRVGLPQGFPPFSSGPAQRPRGFLVDMARYIGSLLDVRVEYSMAPMEEMPHLANRQKVDVAYSAQAVTGKLLAHYPVGTPYFVVHQRLLVRKSSGISDVRDVNGKRLCTSIQPSTEIRLETIGVRPASDVEAPIHRCLRLMAKGEVDVVTAADAKLLAGVAAHPEWTITGDELTTEGYGVIGAPPTKEGGRGWIAFLDRALYYFKDTGRWMRSYDRHVAPLVDRPLDEPPHMSAGDAAALYPELIPLEKE